MRIVLPEPPVSGSVDVSKFGSAKLAKRRLVTLANTPNWGDARISHKTTWPATDYIYDDTAGAGTCIYVIDTGVFLNHRVRCKSTTVPYGYFRQANGADSEQEFGGRATWGANFVVGSPVSGLPSSLKGKPANDQSRQDEDENGHGTHVAGTAAGENVGVANNANIVAVKILDAAGSGTLAGVIAGLVWGKPEHSPGPHQS